MFKKKIQLLSLFLLFIPALVLSEDKYRFHEIKAEKGALIINFQVRDLMGSDIITGLRKGLTAGIEYQIQLWKKRPRWIDELVTERIVRMKINFDNILKMYIYNRRNEEPYPFNEDDLIKKCSRLVEYPIVPLSELESGNRYIIAIKVVLQPMTVENYQEIKRWLSGEVKEINTEDIKKTGEKAGNWILDLVLKLTGFGDRFISAKSPVFIWRDGEIINEDVR